MTVPQMAGLTTIISRYGTEAQKRRWLPGICDGTGTMAFAITEPDAGTNTHNITTTARGDEDGGLVQLFAGLNPERIMAASFSTGLARFALDRAAAYARERTVFQGPIGSHQAIAHPLAQSKIEIELARLMTQKAAALYEEGDDMGAGEAANMAKYAAAEAAVHAVDAAVQTHGGNGITQEYGMAGLLVAARAGRIAPVSREMILNYVAMHSLGLPKSY